MGLPARLPPIPGIALMHLLSTGHNSHEGGEGAHYARRALGEADSLGICEQKLYTYLKTVLANSSTPFL